MTFFFLLTKTFRRWKNVMWATNGYYIFIVFCGWNASFYDSSVSWEFDMIMVFRYFPIYCLSTEQPERTHFLAFVDRKFTCRLLLNSSFFFFRRIYSFVAYVCVQLFAVDFFYRACEMQWLVFTFLRLQLLFNGQIFGFLVNKLLFWWTNGIMK